MSNIGVFEKIWLIRQTNRANGVLIRQADDSQLTCSSVETIQHLFFHCHVANFVWNTVHITFRIQPPTSFANLFGSLHGLLSLKLGNLILLGVVALCWVIRLNRINDIRFLKDCFRLLARENSCIRGFSTGGGRVVANILQKCPRQF